MSHYSHISLDLLVNISCLDTSGEHIFKLSPSPGEQGLSPPHFISLVRVLASGLLHCIFPWLCSSSDKFSKTGPSFPPQRAASLGFVAQTGECWLAEGATGPSLPETHVPCRGLTLELWALSNHIWLIRLPVQGLSYPWTNLMLPHWGL